MKTKELQNKQKTCTVIRLNPDGDPLFHIKQSKNMCCFLSKKIDSKEKRIFFYPKYISQYKMSPEDRKKILFWYVSIKKTI